ncbi:MAG: hypothetical protein ABI681_04060 [Gemmatimonadales bacterium]
MKAFLLTAGIVFGLIVIAHIWRVAVESTALAKDPWFILMTLLSAGLSFWAFRLLRRTARAKDVS